MRGFALFWDVVKETMGGGEVGFVKLERKARSDDDVMAEHFDHCERYKWYCPVCSLMNASGTSMCTMCNHVRKAEGPMEAWACKTCTFINSGEGSVCSVCGLPRTDV